MENASTEGWGNTNLVFKDPYSVKLKLSYAISILIIEKITFMLITCENMSEDLEA